MKILFVCRGNVGRSQMAEAILRQMLPEAEISSAGTRVLDKDGTSRHGQLLKDLQGAERVIIAMKESGIDVGENARTQLAEESLAEHFDRVIVMAEPQHIPEWLSRHPNYAYWHVEDPKDTDLEFHRSIRDQIKGLIEENMSLFK